MPFQELYLQRFLVAEGDTLILSPRDVTFLVILLVAIQCFALCLSIYMLYKSYKKCRVLQREEALELIRVLVHDGQPYTPPPFSPRISRDVAEPETCNICLEEYAKGEEVSLVPSCRHLFHKTCVESCLATRSSFCPVCAED